MEFLDLLNIAISLIVVFFLFSTACSSLYDLCSSLFQIRPELLRRSIVTLLTGRAADRLSGRKRLGKRDRVIDMMTAGVPDPFLADFWAHPTIASQLPSGRLGPSYIAGTAFALAAVDTALKLDGAPVPSTRAGVELLLTRRATGTADPSIDPVAAEARKHFGGVLLRLLRAQPLSGGASANGPEATTALTNQVGRWFDEAQKRTTGDFKRRVSYWLFAFGLITAAALNVDTVRMFHVLSHNRELSAKLADYGVAEYRRRAEQANAASTPAPAAAVNPPGAPTTTSPTAPTPATPPDKLEAWRESFSADLDRLRDLDAIGFPLGWAGVVATDFLPWSAKPPSTASSTDKSAPAVSSSTEKALWVLILAKLAGLLVTAFAISMGAPFWFDLLGKVASVRTAGSKPKETAEIIPRDSGAGPLSAALAIVPPGAGPVFGSAGASAAPVVGTIQRTALNAQSELAAAGADFDPCVAYWLSVISDVAYEDLARVSTVLKEDLGFTEVELFGLNQTANDPLSPDTQVIFAEGHGFAVVAFRGTEQKPSDFWTDAQAKLTQDRKLKGAELASALVHEGFRTALDAADPTFAARLAAWDKPLLLTGHSLGGALATLQAARLLSGGANVDIRALYTFGAPALGNGQVSAFLNQKLGDRFIRMVNDLDIVPRLPSKALSYEHAGRLMMFDRTGKLHVSPALWSRVLGLVSEAAVLNSMKGFGSKSIGDHKMKLYQTRCAALVGIHLNGSS